MATLWTAAYTATFDWMEGRCTMGRADRRPMGLRALHAIELEGRLACLTVPMLAVACGLPWLKALAADLALTAAYACYALGFHLVYDAWFPLTEKEAARAAVEGAPSGDVA